ncbi:MAG: GNAT family N-acetyltransferase [Tepidisphaeraceae bacterium]
MSFCFLDPGPLVDGELELIAPEPKWFDQMLASCWHPLCQNDARARRITREWLVEQDKAAPGGRFSGVPHEGRAPAYAFWMRLRPQHHPVIPIAGTIGLRIGNSYELEMYFGHLGYNVFEPARGIHLAERSCRLLLPLARAHGLKSLWITCNPDNSASRRTCERLGALLVETVPIPESNILYQRGDRVKCRYRLDL